MEKIKKLFIILTILIIPSLLFSKTSYIITLKGGTKIKADSYLKEKGFVKVYKFGGYIIYPAANIKSIKKVFAQEEVKKSNKKNSADNASKKNKRECMPVVKKIETLPVYNKERKDFDLKLTGNIINNCPKNFTDIKLTVNFYNEKNEKLFTKIVNLDDIVSYDQLDFNKIFNDVNVSEIKYFNYKLEFLPE